MRESIRIESRHFVAAVDLGPGGHVVHAAPILSYMRGWPKERVIKYALHRKWTVTVLPISQEPSA